MERYTLTGQDVLNGCKDQVYLVKSANDRGFVFKAFDFSEEDLITFETKKQAYEFSELHKQDLAEVIPLSEVF